MGFKCRKKKRTKTKNGKGAHEPFLADTREEKKKLKEKKGRRKKNNTKREPCQRENQLTGLLSRRQRTLAERQRWRLHGGVFGREQRRWTRRVHAEEREKRKETSKKRHMGNGVLIWALRSGFELMAINGTRSCCSNLVCINGGMATPALCARIFSTISAICFFEYTIFGLGDSAFAGWAGRPRAGNSGKSSLLDGDTEGNNAGCCEPCALASCCCCCCCLPVPPRRWPCCPPRPPAPPVRRWPRSPVAPLVPLVRRGPPVAFLRPSRPVLAPRPLPPRPPRLPPRCEENRPLEPDELRPSPCGPRGCVPGCWKPPPFIVGM